MEKFWQCAKNTLHLKTLRKSTTSENWAKLLEVMKSVHAQNRGISEEDVYQDVERAVAELRQEEYDKQKKTARSA